MRYSELLVEMAFPRKRIIRALESYDTRIFEHATKILLMPNSQNADHWRQELLAWCGYLASLRLKVRRGPPPPMGFDLAYDYLYRGPFVGNESGMTAHFVRMVKLAYRLDIDPDMEQVHQRLQAFLTQVSRDIGAGDEARVEATIRKL